MTLLTFEEFERLPDRPGKCELVRGELIELPPAEIRHDRTSRRLFKGLDSALAVAHARSEALDLGEVCIESGYQLSSNTWVKPDVSVTYACQQEGKYLCGAPAIAIEIVSPSNSAADLDDETQLYFECGAREIWLIYPKTKRAMVYSDGVPRVVKADEAFTTPLLPGFSMTLTEILGA